MIFKNGRLIFPNGLRDGLDLLVEDGMITAIRPQAHAMGEKIVDIEGNYLAPGFIDLHVHGAMGRDTMQACAPSACPRAVNRHRRADQRGGIA